MFCITLTVNDDDDDDDNNNNNNNNYSVAIIAGWSTKRRLLSVYYVDKRDVYVPTFLTSVTSRLLRSQYFLSPTSISPDLHEHDF